MYNQLEPCVVCTGIDIFYAYKCLYCSIHGHGYDIKHELMNYALSFYLFKGYGNIVINLSELTKKYDKALCMIWKIIHVILQVITSD